MQVCYWGLHKVGRVHEKNSKVKGKDCVDEDHLQKEYKKNYLAKVDGRTESVEKGKPQAEKCAEFGIETEKEETETKEREEGEQKVFFVDVGCVEHDNVSVFFL